ncbi:MAG TPA: tetratricopeptide repeat protein [Candidatus Methylomirabilis sp.]|nr:tetratricopeptide repeat protein [Candidatus Methylomirabilis sp.]
MKVRPGHRFAATCLFLALSVLAVYGRTAWHPFITFDDEQYVASNPVVQRGLTADGAAWAFRTTHATNWHPLTWLSHMTDVELFGVDPGAHHLVNVLLHAANAVLLFLALRAMTGAAGRSAFVAALFALHPLHVESVAWIAERKDLLSGMFWILSMWAYAAYAARGGMPRYLLTAGCLALSLLSKPMAVTLPFVFLLLDFWPLRRAGTVPPRRLVLEKVPFLALALASCVVTYAAQKSGGAVSPFPIPVGARLANAAVSYVAYLGKTFLPVSLSVFYPHPWSFGGPGHPAWQWGGAVLSLAALTALALRGAKERPYLATGWLWFLGTLVPVIGLVQAGEQGMADRYTYLPLTGVFLIVAWGVPDALGDRPWRRPALGAAAGAALAALATVSFAQAGLWRDSVTLFRHAAAVTENNWMAHANLGLAFERTGDVRQAVSHYEEAVRLKPEYELARNNLGSIYERSGRLDEAIVQFRFALAYRPDYAEAHNNLGIALAEKGLMDEAILHFREAIRLNPGFVLARENLEKAMALKSVKSP